MFISWRFILVVFLSYECLPGEKDASYGNKPHMPQDSLSTVGHDVDWWIRVHIKVDASVHQPALFHSSSHFQQGA